MKLFTLTLSGLSMVALALGCGGRTLDFGPDFDGGLVTGNSGGGGAMAQGGGGSSSGSGGSSRGGGGAQAQGGGGSSSGGSAGMMSVNPNCKAPLKGTGGDKASCGGKACKDGMFMAVGCCFDSASGKCGFSFAGAACMEGKQAGELDSACPDQPNPNYMPIMMNGCCRPDGICGVLENNIGLGCTTFDGKLQMPNVACGCAKK